MNGTFSGVLSEGVQSYLRQYGYSVTSGGIVLYSRLGDGDDMYRYCSDLVNSLSIDFTPFAQIRLTINTDFASGNNGVGSVGDVYFLSTTKKQISYKYSVIHGGYGVDSISSIDVSNINQQAFFRFDIRSAGKAGGSNTSSTVTIKKIEFLV